MGRIFALPPSPFEADHWRFVVASDRYQDAHDGALPDLLAWHRLERRYDLDPERFTANHENIAAMIERARQDAARPDFWPIDRCSPYVPECGSEQPPAHGGGAQQVVPEPAGLALALVAAIVWMGVMWRRRG